MLAAGCHNCARAGTRTSGKHSQSLRSTRGGRGNLANNVRESSRLTCKSSSAKTSGSQQPAIFFADSSDDRPKSWEGASYQRPPPVLDWPLRYTHTRDLANHLESLLTSLPQHSGRSGRLKRFHPPPSAWINKTVFAIRRPRILTAVTSSMRAAF